MLGRIVTTLKRLMGFQSTPASEVLTDLPSNTVKASPAKSGQVSAKPRKPSPARTPRKPKQEAAPSTTAARKPGKKKPTARQVAMVSQSKPTGSKSKTPASKTRQHAK